MRALIALTFLGATMSAYAAIYPNPAGNGPSEQDIQSLIANPQSANAKGFYFWADGKQRTYVYTTGPCITPALQHGSPHGNINGSELARNAISGSTWSPVQWLTLEHNSNGKGLAYGYAAINFCEIPTTSKNRCVDGGSHTTRCIFIC